MLIVQIILSVLRGILLCSPVLIVGILIAPYVPPFWIGMGTMVLLVVTLYIAGEVLNWPIKRRQKWQKR